IGPCHLCRATKAQCEGNFIYNFSTIQKPQSKHKKCKLVTRGRSTSPAKGARIRTQISPGPTIPQNARSQEAAGWPTTPGARAVSFPAGTPAPLPLPEWQVALSIQVEVTQGFVQEQRTTNVLPREKMINRIRLGGDWGRVSDNAATGLASSAVVWETKSLAGGPEVMLGCPRE
ncbi:hypothetical protein H1C71_021102, partial [Ictidomys tridecemlineatus]